MNDSTTTQTWTTDGISTQVRQPTLDKPWHLPRGGFINPWKSYGGLAGFWEMAKLIWKFKDFKIPEDASQRPIVRQMNWEQIRNPPKESAQLTWLGHASFLLQLRGKTILTDPVFSPRCSPSSYFGPKRYSKSPCEIEDLPKVDFVLLSHNHYDHMDLATLKRLNQDVTFFVGLGNGAWLKSNGFSRFYELDWWDEIVVDELRISCTPAQHFSSRTLWDRNRTLWCGWSLKLTRENQSSFSYFFAGDTGYSSVSKTDFESDLIVSSPRERECCPAFKEIGDKLGPFNLACIPIGAYLPRRIMSGVHCAPEDAVCIHQDIRSNLSIGMHWGTFPLTLEPIMDPPARLNRALDLLGVSPSAFRACDIGETMNIPFS